MAAWYLFVRTDHNLRNFQELKTWVENHSLYMCQLFKVKWSHKGWDGNVIIWEGRRRGVLFLGVCLPSALHRHLFNWNSHPGRCLPLFCTWGNSPEESFMTSQLLVTPESSPILAKMVPRLLGYAISISFHFLRLKPFFFFGESGWIGDQTLSTSELPLSLTQLLYYGTDPYIFCEKLTIHLTFSYQNLYRK